MFATIRDGGATKLTAWAAVHSLWRVLLSCFHSVSTLVRRKAYREYTILRTPAPETMSACSEPTRYTCKYCQRRVAHTVQGLRTHQRHGKCKAAYDTEMKALTNTHQSPLMAHEATRATSKHGLDDNSTFFDPPRSPTPAPLESEAAHGPPSSKRRRVEVEGVADDETVFVETFPLESAGAWVEEKPGRTPFELHRDAQRAKGLPPWAPYDSLEDWELASWLIKSGVSQSRIDSFFKLRKVRYLSPSLNVSPRAHADPL